MRKKAIPVLEDLMARENTSEKEALDRERWEVLQRLEDWLEVPMLVLGFAWLALLIVELSWGLNRFLELVVLVIWITFILDFAVKFILAPSKETYLKRNWLTAVALLIPALRVFRVARVLYVLRATRATRGIRLVRLISSLNRGMGVLGATMGRRGFGYVAAFTIVVTLAGAAGMLAFEKQLPNGGGLNGYGTALWWTAMIMTTMGSEYWPATPEGRLLCFLLALYAFAVFGYVTATLASFFINQDAESDEAVVAGARSVESLRADIAALHAELRALADRDRG